MSLVKTKPFIYRQTVLFQHCDPARIVFYPRYYEMINAAIESWFEQVIEINFFKLHNELNAGLPTASIETRFLRPSRLGDSLEFQIMPVQLGTSSMTLEISASCQNQTRLQTKQVLVYVDGTTLAPQTWHADISLAVAKYLN